MSIARYAGDRFVGDSSDPFPMSVKDGGEFFQQDSKTIYLKISGVWTPIAGSGTAGSFSGFADPTTQIGLTTVPGTATTAMRSDAAPSLSTNINPKWTHIHQWVISSDGHSQGFPRVQLLNTGISTSSGVKNSTSIVFQGHAWDYRLTTGSDATSQLYLGLNMQSISGKAHRGILFAGPSFGGGINQSVFTAPFTLSDNSITGLSNFVVGYTGFPLNIHQDYGYLYIKYTSGVPTGTPYNEGPYHVPLTFDAVNNHIYFYNNGWKNASLGTGDTIVNGIDGEGTPGYFAMFTGTTEICSTAMVSSGKSAYLPSGRLGMGGTPGLKCDVFGGFAVRPILNDTWASGSTVNLGMGDWTYIKLHSHSQDPNSVIFNLTKQTSHPGQIAILEWGTGFGKYPQTTGSTFLNSDWVPNSGDTLSLIFNSNYWLEIARSNVSGGSSLVNGISGAGTPGYFAMFTGVNEIKSTAMVSSGNSAYLPSGIIGLGGIPNVGCDVYGGFATRRMAVVTLPSGEINSFTVGNASFIKINSQSQDANSVCFYPNSQGTQGQRLVLHWGTGFGKMVDNSGVGITTRLNGDWIPSSGDTIELIWNGEKEWLEISRSNVSGSSAGGAVNGITGVGTNNFIPIWVSNSGLGNSVIYQSGYFIGVGKNNPSQQLELTGNLQLPNSNTTTAGIIKFGTATEIHNKGFNSFAAGESVGLHTFNEQTVSIGYRTNRTGFSFGSVFIGSNTVRDNSFADYSVYIGNEAGLNVQTGHYNVGIGAFALRSAGLTNRAERCVAIGNAALDTLGDFVYDNTACGDSALTNARSGQNTALGSLAGSAIKFGEGNVAVGYQACSSGAPSRNLTGTISIGVNSTPNRNYDCALGTEHNNITTKGTTSWQPVIKYIDSVAGFQVSGSKMLISGSGAAFTITATPSISGGFDGQMVMLMGCNNTNTVTLQSEASLAGSTLQLGAATRTLGQFDTLVMSYDNTFGKWHEVTFTNN